MEGKMRLVTRSDFDGLACAMMLRELGIIDEIKFVHPKDVQDGKVELSQNDITTNLPYDPRVALASPASVTSSWKLSTRATRPTSPWTRSFTPKAGSSCIT